MSQHTKGEWLTYADYSGAVASIVIQWKNHTVKAVCDINQELKESEANAHLIAASPLLYEALKGILDKQDDYQVYYSLSGQVWIDIENAIAKAEGK